MATREPDRPLQRWMIARGRSASLPLSYTTTRDTTFPFPAATSHGTFVTRQIGDRSAERSAIADSQLRNHTSESLVGDFRSVPLSFSLRIQMED